MRMVTTDFTTSPIHLIDPPMPEHSYSSAVAPTTPIRRFSLRHLETDVMAAPMKKSTSRKLTEPGVEEAKRQRTNEAEPQDPFILKHEPIEVPDIMLSLAEAASAFSLLG